VAVIHLADALDVVTNFIVIANVAVVGKIVAPLAVDDNLVVVANVVQLVATLARKDYCCC